MPVIDERIQEFLGTDFVVHCPSCQKDTLHFRPRLIFWVEFDLDACDDILRCGVEPRFESRACVCTGWTDKEIDLARREALQKMGEQYPDACPKPVVETFV